MIKLNAFDDVLSSLKVSGMCLLAEDYTPPWAVSIPDGAELGKALSAPRDTRLFAFHLVRRGSFELHIDGEPLLVSAGEVVILTGSQSHIMANGKAAETIDFFDLINDRPAYLDAESEQEPTSLICGAFLLGNASNNPLISALPPVIHADVSRETGDRTLHLLAQLLISQTENNRHLESSMSARILEMFCAEAIRLYVKTNDPAKQGWFRGLNDEKIGAALNHIHARPEAPWSVASLAREVGMSPSRFAARFRQTLETSPMNYVTRWRMNIASRILIETKHTTSHVAHKVGYESTPAFTRAFTRHYNAPPARWRREQRAQA